MGGRNWSSFTKASSCQQDKSYFSYVFRTPDWLPIHPREKHLHISIKVLFSWNFLPSEERATPSFVCPSHTKLAEPAGTNRWRPWWPDATWRSDSCEWMGRNGMLTTTTTAVPQSALHFICWSTQPCLKTCLSTMKLRKIWNFGMGPTAAAIQNVELMVIDTDRKTPLPRSHSWHHIKINKGNKKHIKKPLSLMKEKTNYKPKSQTMTRRLKNQTSIG